MLEGSSQAEPRKQVNEGFWPGRKSSTKRPCRTLEQVEQSGIDRAVLGCPGRASLQVCAPKWWPLTHKSLPEVTPNLPSAQFSRDGRVSAADRSVVQSGSPFVSPPQLRP